MLTIDINTKISRIIKEDARAIEALASLSPKFKKLRNPVLRKVLASRVTVADAARIGNVKKQDLLEVLKNIGFSVEMEEKKQDDELQPERTELSNHPEDRMVTLDVRPILESGADPFREIMKQLEGLPEENALKLINSFKPLPLYRVLQKQGFRWCTIELQDDLFEIYIKKGSRSDPSSPEIRNGESGSKVDQDIGSLLSLFGESQVSIDVRGMEMPQPMINILETLETLDKGNALFVQHERVPQYLLPELEAKGYSYALEEIADGDVRLLIYRESPPKAVS